MPVMMEEKKGEYPIDTWNVLLGEKYWVQLYVFEKRRQVKMGFHGDGTTQHVIIDYDVLLDPEDSSLRKSIGLFDTCEISVWHMPAPHCLSKTAIIIYYHSESSTVWLCLRNLGTSGTHNYLAASFDLAKDKGILDLLHVQKHAAKEESTGEKEYRETIHNNIGLLENILIDRSSGKTMTEIRSLLSKIYTYAVAMAESIPMAEMEKLVEEKIKESKDIKRLEYINDHVNMIKNDLALQYKTKTLEEWETFFHAMDKFIIFPPETDLSSTKEYELDVEIPPPRIILKEEEKTSTLESRVIKIQGSNKNTTSTLGHIGPVHVLYNAYYVGSMFMIKFTFRVGDVQKTNEMVFGLLSLESKHHLGCIALEKEAKNLSFTLCNKEGEEPYNFHLVYEELVDYASISLYIEMRDKPELAKRVAFFGFYYGSSPCSGDKKVAITSFPSMAEMLKVISVKSSLGTTRKYLGTMGDQTSIYYTLRYSRDYRGKLHSEMQIYFVKMDGSTFKTLECKLPLPSINVGTLDSSHMKYYNNNIHEQLSLLIYNGNKTEKDMGYSIHFGIINTRDNYKLSVITGFENMKRVRCEYSFEIPSYKISSIVCQKAFTIVPILEEKKKTRSVKHVDDLPAKAVMTSSFHKMSAFDYITEDAHFLSKEEEETLKCHTYPHLTILGVIGHHSIKYRTMKDEKDSDKLILYIQVLNMSNYEMDYEFFTEASYSFKDKPVFEPYSSCERDIIFTIPIDPADDSSSKGFCFYFVVRNPEKPESQVYIYSGYANMEMIHKVKTFTFVHPPPK
jgi:hypothetical protein